MADSVLEQFDENGDPAEGVVPAGENSETISGIQLAGLIREDSARILANWSMRVATLPVFRAVPELALDDLQEDMPELLESILNAVSVAPYELDPAPRDQAALCAESHGERRAHDFPIEAVLAEVQSLQREVRNALWRLGPEARPEVVHELDERLNEVFEIAERSIATAWVRNRYESSHPNLTGAAA